VSKRIGVTAGTGTGDNVYPEYRSVLMRCIYKLFCSAALVTCAALKEYDFTDAAWPTTSAAARRSACARCASTTPAAPYGAYSFYRQNGWPKEEIGTGATSNHNRVLFWVGNTVVDANFSRIGPMSGRGAARAGQPVARSRRRRALRRPS
jgi:hypothetical protein